MIPCGWVWGKYKTILHPKYVLTLSSFNSYTQTCCINDAVQRVDGIKATENDLRPAKQVQAANTPSASTSDEEKIGVDLPKALQNASGSSVIETTDGQTLVSQLVTWEAKFVTKISEVTDSMNISGWSPLPTNLLKEINSHRRACNQNRCNWWRRRSKRSFY